MNTKIIRITFLSLFMLLLTNTAGAHGINIIPKPLKCELKERKGFTINSKTKVIYHPELASQASLFVDYIYAPTALKLNKTQGHKPEKNSILFALDNSIDNEEGYNLTVSDKQIIIKSKSAAGAFYAMQSLMQLLPPEIESKQLKEIDLTVPVIFIEDAPTFKWRGAMLDVSRYFFSKEFVLKYIDMMSLYKLNTLHFHLIDDAGWRLEIKKYPLLTEVGGFRGEGENRTGGFYTQEDIKEMVAYAEARGIVIVPEIAFPAHVLSGVVAYPWLSCREEQLKVLTQHYISKDLICPGKQTTIDFLKDVLEETCELFPSKYIHIGGDEAVYQYWNNCPHCQKLLKEQGLEKSSQLQGYLTNLVADMAAKHNRTIVGWDEILERGKVTKPVVSMIWRNMNNLDHVYNQGHKAVLCPTSHLYFDTPESRLPSEIKAATWLAPISLEKCYSFATEKFEGDSVIIGLQAALWGDQFIFGTLLQELDLLDENRSENYVEYLMLPRLMAMSEIGWTPSQMRNYEEFFPRVLNHFKRLDNAGFTYRVPSPDVKHTKVDEGYMIELSTPLDNATIHYTTNGERATPYDKLYTAPFQVNQLSDVRAVTALTKTHHSVPTFFTENYDAYKQYGTFAKRVRYNEVTDQNTVDLTGKINADGEYQITIVALTDGVDVAIGEIEIMKNNDKTSGTAINSIIADKPVSGKFIISEWQAGTPYSAVMKLNAGQNNRGNIAVFIKKL